MKFFLLSLLTFFFNFKTEYFFSKKKKLDFFVLKNRNLFSFKKNHFCNNFKIGNLFFKIKI